MDRSQVAAGFAACYELLLQHRDQLLSDSGPLASFAGDSVRSVLRNTRVYAGLLEESWHPDLLRDGMDRDWFFGVLAERGSFNDDPALLHSEWRQLAQQDVPVFGVAVAGTSLKDPWGDVVPDFFQRPGMSHVRERLMQLSRADLDTQLWYAHAALATLNDDARLRQRSGPAGRQVEDAVLDPAEAVDAAQLIANRLIETAVRDSTGPEWLTLNRLGYRAWSIGATDLGLSDGVTGIALFLAEFDSLVGAPGCRTLVEELVAGLLDPREIPDLQNLAGMAVGLFEELGSLLFLVARLRELWGVDGFPDFGWLVEAVRSNIDHDDISVRSGVAGAVIALSTLRRSYYSEAVDAALERAAEILMRLTFPVEGPSGFGRGSAGIALIMARVGRSLNIPALAEAAIRLLRAPEQPSNRSEFGWCRGSAGTAMAAAELLQMSELAEWHSGIRSILDRSAVQLDQAVRLDGCLVSTGDDSLCHGDLALAEALALVGDTTGQEGMHSTAQSLVADVGRRARMGRTITAAPTGVWVPGLLHGGPELVTDCCERLCQMRCRVSSSRGVSAPFHESTPPWKMSS